MWDPASLPALETIPWPEVLKLAVPSNVGAVVHAVTVSRADALPRDVREELEQAFYRTAAANTRCLHQLAELGAPLAAEGIPLLLLKGAALAPALYSDSALRLIGDIDLAVPRASAPACGGLLRGLGYLPSQVEEQPGSLLAQSNQERFQPPSPHQAVVELHWHILDVPYYLQSIPMDWFWHNTEVLSLAGQTFQVLNPQANLIYLPAHLALHHQFHGLHSLLDLALLIVRQQHRLDWEALAATARDFDLLVALRATLERLAECWPSLPVEEARRRLNAVEPSETDQRLFRLLTAGARNVPQHVYTTLLSLPGLAARARFVWVNVFPQATYMMRRYGFRSRWHLPYWYLYRLVAGLSRMARALPAIRRQDRAPH